MKASFLMLLLLLILPISACSKSDIENDSNKNSTDINNTNPKSMQLTVNSVSYRVTLENNAAARSFVSLLPTTIVMGEMNGNEKYYNLAQNLPTNPTQVNTIHVGDIMLFGSSTLVVFYKTFTTSYRYTRIGRIDNPTNLENNLGKQQVTISFESSQE